MEAERAVAELERFLADRGDQLLRTATLLAGSREAGEDLLQTGLERLLRHWAAIDGNPEGYLRRTLYHLAADRDRTWWTAAWSRAPPLGRPVLSGYRADGWPGIIQYELSVHVFRVAGHQVIDGTNAIKLVTASGSATMWVNPATYLPVRYDVDGSQTDYRWLTPTAAHLALLDLPIPAGFTQVPPAQQ